MFQTNLVPYNSNVKNVHLDYARGKDVLMNVFVKNKVLKMVVNTLNFVFLVIECSEMTLSVEVIGKVKMNDKEIVMWNV